MNPTAPVTATTDTTIFQAAPRERARLSGAGSDEVGMNKC